MFLRFAKAVAATIGIPALLIVVFLTAFLILMVLARGCGRFMAQ
jgi:hypothetical protein